MSVTCVPDVAAYNLLNEINGKNRKFIPLAIIFYLLLVKDEDMLRLVGVST